MRRAAKVDANQGEIVAALRKSGCSVEPLHSVGGGVPDLLVGVPDVGIDGINLLMEVKDGAKPPSARKLTPDQVDWHAAWLGQKVVVTSVEEALDVVEGFRRTCGPKQRRHSRHTLSGCNGSRRTSRPIGRIKSARSFRTSLWLSSTTRLAGSNSDCSRTF